MVKPTTPSVAPWTRSPKAAACPAAVPEHSKIIHSREGRPFDFAKAPISFFRFLRVDLADVEGLRGAVRRHQLELRRSTSIATTVAPSAAAIWTQ